MRIEQAPGTTHLYDEDGYYHTIDTTHEQGTELVVGFARQEISFDKLQPFTIAPEKVMPKGKHHIVDIGRKQGVVYGASLDSGTHEVGQQGSLVAIPKTDAQKLYTWLELYDASQEQAQMPQILKHIRVNERENKVGSRSWFGPEVQAYIDFLKGEDHIEATNLRPFTGNVKYKHERNNPYAFWEQEATKYYVYLPNNDLLAKDAEITFVPQYDETRGYVWIDGYIMHDDGPVQVSSSRIHKGSKTAQRWNGPEVQSIADWACGSSTYELTKPTTYSFRYAKSDARLSSGKDHSLLLRLANVVPQDTDCELILIPKEEPPHKWVEIYTKRIGDREVVRHIASPRIDEHKGKYKFNYRWEGIERQRYNDYLESGLEGTIPPTFLLEIPKNGRTQPFRVQGKALYFSFVESDQYFPGQQVVLLPKKVNDHQLLFQAIRPGEPYPFKQFMYDTRTGIIQIPKDDSLNVQKPKDYWNPKKIEQEARKYIGADSTVTLTELKRLGREDLTHAILNFYTGGLYELNRILSKDETLTPYEDLPKLEKGSRTLTHDGALWATRGYFRGDYPHYVVYEALKEAPFMLCVNRGTLTRVYEEESARQTIEDYYRRSKHGREHAPIDSNLANQTLDTLLE